MSPGPEDDISQAEKRRIIREQATTMYQHARSAANDEAGGRFASVNAAMVVGAEPALKYPAASSGWQIQLPDEPPLSAHENPALEPSAVPHSPVEQVGDPVDAPPSGHETAPAASEVSDERAGSPLSTDDGGSDDAA
jgi:hypothetical protein